MKEPKLKTVYVCSNCGETSPRWMGRCPSCGSWNTMNEDVVAEAPKAGLSGSKAAAPARQEGVTSLTARRLADISTTEEKSRILTGISELDRVLGGGIVLGGVVLLSGEPGVGKSTMLLQLCGAISNQHSVLYITGEESVRQVKLRAARLKVPQENIYLAAENDVDEICGLIEKEKPELVVIDSIQTMRCMDLSSSAGTVSQVKESAARLLAVAGGCHLADCSAVGRYQHYGREKPHPDRHIGTRPGAGRRHCAGRRGSAQRRTGCWQIYDAFAALRCHLQPAFCSVYHG